MYTWTVQTCTHDTVSCVCSVSPFAHDSFEHYWSFAHKTKAKSQRPKEQIGAWSSLQSQTFHLVSSNSAGFLRSCWSPELSALAVRSVSHDDADLVEAKGRKRITINDNLKVICDDLWGLVIRGLARIQTAYLKSFDCWNYSKKWTMSLFRRNLAEVGWGAMAWTQGSDALLRREDSKIRRFEDSAFLDLFSSSFCFVSSQTSFHETSVEECCDKFQNMENLWRISYGLGTGHFLASRFRPYFPLWFWAFVVQSLLGTTGLDGPVLLHGSTCGTPWDPTYSSQSSESSESVPQLAVSGHISACFMMRAGTSSNFSDFHRSL